MRVDVSFVPPDRPPTEQTCLVVDVLRATSSIVALLGRGIGGVHPVASVTEGRTRRDALQRELGTEVALCGEQNALPPDGYDFGNSPSELAAVPLRWREVVMATTNGTPALLACASAPLTLAAAPLNAAAVTRAAIEAGHDVLVVCAGEGGRRSDDDALAAGLLVERLIAAGAEPGQEARRARALHEPVRDQLAAALRATRHGERLAELGFAHDLEFCATVDRFDVAGALRREDAGFVLRPIRVSTEQSG